MQLRWPLLLSVLGHALVLAYGSWPPVLLPWHGSAVLQVATGLPGSGRAGSSALPGKKMAVPVDRPPRLLSTAPSDESLLPLDTTAVSATGSEAKALPPAPVSGEALFGYRLALARAARSGLRSKAIGSGRVELILVHGVSGPMQVVVGRSSGDASLDEWALRLIRQAVAQVSLPPALSDQPWRLLLPVEFAADALD